MNEWLKNKRILVSKSIGVCLTMSGILIDICVTIIVNDTDVKIHCDISLFENETMTRTLKGPEWGSPILVLTSL